MKQNEYTEQAERFLAEASATISIEFIGRAINTEWKETKERNKYSVTITTQRGAMTFDFWDSLHNTEITAKRPRDYSEALKLNREKAAAKPTAYDVLACLTKYDPGLFEEFCADYGYDADSRTAERTYHAVMREYKQLDRIFTAEQTEELREIQ